MRIGFVYESFDASVGSFGAHGYFLATELIRRGHELWGPGLPDMPGCVSLPPNRWGKLRMIRHADVLYIRVNNLHWMERCTWLRLLRPRCPVAWELNGTSETLLHGGLPESKAEELHGRDVRRKRRMAKLVDVAFCIGRSRAEYAREVYGLRQCVAIPNGGDLDARRPDGGGTAMAAVKDRFKVFWAGDASLPWQGLDQIVQAAAICERQAQDVLFVLMLGGPGAAPRLPHLANTVLLSGRDRSTVCRYLADCDCALSLYREDPGRQLRLAYPLKTLEAMAARKPVVFDWASEEFARDGIDGLRVAGDAESLVRAIVRLRDDAALRDRLAESARRTIEESLTWRHVVDRIEPVLLDLVPPRWRAAAVPAVSGVAGG